jgi:hypothetical protein
MSKPLKDPDPYKSLLDQIVGGQPARAMGSNGVGAMTSSCEACEKVPRMFLSTRTASEHHALIASLTKERDELRAELGKEKDYSKFLLEEHDGRLAERDELRERLEKLAAKSRALWDAFPMANYSQEQHIAFGECAYEFERAEILLKERGKGNP